MSAKAKMSSGWRLRLGVMAAAVVAFGLWFLYDGTVKYPEQHERWQAYQPFIEDYQGPERRQRWAEYAEQQGWPTDAPEERSQADILMQRVIAGILLPLGAVLSVLFARSTLAWIGMDEQGLHTHAGKRVPWDAVKQIDKSRWDSKGIAVVHYQDEQGHEKTLTLDDWKYDGEPINQMLAELERRTGLGGEASEAEHPESPNDQA